MRAECRKDLTADPHQRRGDHGTVIETKKVRQGRYMISEGEWTFMRGNIVVGSVVISSLRAEGLSFVIYLTWQGDIQIDNKQSFLHNASLWPALSLVAMLSQLNDQPFGIPLSLPQHL